MDSAERNGSGKGAGVAAVSTLASISCSAESAFGRILSGSDHRSGQRHDDDSERQRDRRIPVVG